MAYLFRQRARVLIRLEFWCEEDLLNHPEDAGVVFVVEIPSEEFVGILEGIDVALGDGSGEGGCCLS
ncbi:hypothetical protein [Streptomyces sp. NPDC002463]|uniref:hypothetical protein n=1 Tax=Streptomyces sp. NPDC002463 TaxID=3364645 RepID=UPI0036BB78FD